MEKLLQHFRRMLRVELCTSKAPHFICIDAIQLIGTEERPPKTPATPLHLRPVIQQIATQIPNLDIREEIEKHLKVLKSKQTENCRNFLLDLPKELCLKILEYLDLPDLFRVRMVCKALYDLTSDSSLYGVVDMRSCWHLVSPKLLKNLAPLLEFSRKMDMSWSGPYGRVTPNHFISFIRVAGLRLTHLHLDNCHFMTNDSLYWVMSTCKLLEEVSLQGCKNIDPDGFFHIAMLDRLKKLWVRRTNIQWLGLGAILENSPDLTHLGLGSCKLRASTDFVATTVRRLVPNLRVLDLWRVGRLSASGVEALSCLESLEELEIGWCTNSTSPTSVHISRLVRRYHMLRKIGLAGLRVVYDADLYAIAEFCPNLEFVDVTGNRDVTAVGCIRLLECCTKLQAIDLSYCTNITKQELTLLRSQHPSVSMKAIGC